MSYLNPHTHDLETPPEGTIAAVVHRYVLWLNAADGCDAHRIALRALSLAEHYGSLRDELRAWLHGDTSTLDKVAVASAGVAFSAAVAMHTCDGDANLTSFPSPLPMADRSRIDRAEVRIAIHYGRAVRALGASDRWPGEFVGEMATVAAAASHLIAACGFPPGGMLLDHAREVARQMDERPSGASR
jgi:class 3 adenylate cyclase